MFNKSKKGQWQIPLIIAGVLAIAGFFGGYAIKNSIQNTINSFPGWVWGVLIFILILLILPKKDK